MATDKSLQELLFPDGVCFGCGPANPRGLHLRSFPGNGEVIATWNPSPEYEGWPGIMCGGVLSTLLDCHAVITAVHEIRERDHLTEIPTVLAKGFQVRFLRPVPTAGEVRLSARVLRYEEKGPIVEANLEVSEELCAVLEATLVVRQPRLHRPPT